MKTVFRITLLIFAISSFPTKAVVCTDPTSYVQLLTQYYEDIQQWAEEKLQLEAMRELQKRISDFQLQNQRQNTANDVARTTEVSTQIHNREMDAMLAPAPGTCGIIESSENINSANEVVRNNQKNSARAYVSKRVREVSEKSFHQEKEQEVNTLLDNMYGMEESSPGEVLPVRADIFLGANGNTYSEEDYQAAGMYIDLLMSKHMDSKPPKKPDLEKASDASKAKYLSYLSEVSQNNLIRNSLEAIKNERAPAVDIGGGERVSHLELMERFVKGKWGGNEASEFIALVTNTHENKELDPDNFLTSDAQVLRLLATMEAFSLYMQHRKMEQSLRLEGLEVLQTIQLNKMAGK